MFAGIKKLLKKIILWAIPEYAFYETLKKNVTIGRKAKLYYPLRLSNVVIGDYTYVGRHSSFSRVSIGKFCSIGPNCAFGWGIHPTDGVSTAPMFYSTAKQNGISLTSGDKIVERKDILIGNDVFIGMNVTILDGVTIGDGAVIGAGAVVSKDIPPYAIAYGCPIQVTRYRFSTDVIEELINLKWWDLGEEGLNLVEKDFFNIQEFIVKAKALKKLHP